MLSALNHMTMFLTSGCQHLFLLLYFDPKLSALIGMALSLTHNVSTVSCCFAASCYPSVVLNLNVVGSDSKMNC